MFPTPPNFSETAANGSADSIGPQIEDPLARLRRLFCGIDSCRACQRGKRIEERGKKRGDKNDRKRQRKSKGDEDTQRETKTNGDRLRKGKKGEDRPADLR